MYDNRIDVNCSKCRRGWLIEPKRIEFKGSVEALKRLEKERGRKWQQCYCGTDLYDDTQRE